MSVELKSKEDIGARPTKSRIGEAGIISQKRRVLCYISTRLFEGGGLSAVTLNYCRQIWADSGYNNKVIIDFVSHGRVESALLEEIESHGGRYIELPSRLRKPVSHSRVFLQALQENKYDVLHYNYDSGFDAIDLFISRSYVPTRLCHVHNASPRYPLINRLLKPLVNNSYTQAIACSQKAGEALFGKDSDFVILNNAIKPEKFRFSSEVRLQIRNELRIPESSFVVGNVGRMDRRNQKNHGFLINAFSLSLAKEPNMDLVIVGNGVLMEKWVTLTRELGISDRVHFVGFQTRISDYLQAFDLFCFPSCWEGLGMAAIEAQASGLKCMVSEAVPVEVRLTNNVSFLPIKQGSETIWSEMMLDSQRDNVDRDTESSRAIEMISKGGYDINKEVQRLMDLYEYSSP